MKTKEIAKLLDGKLIGDGELEIKGISSLKRSQIGDLSFLERQSKLNDSEDIGASCLIVCEDFDVEIPTAIIKVKDPKLAFAKAAALLIPPKERRAEIHASAEIAPDAAIGKNVFIGPYCCVGEGSEIGDGTQLRTGAKIGDNAFVGKACVIHPNVFIEDNSLIGDNVILHAGVVIGADGFGFVRGEEGYVKFPQVGRVVIESEVEIGANSCVDRGSLGETRIGEGTKIDNLVQIAHNVTIGKRVVIAAQTGISGSVVIEDDCVIGGQVGFGDHSTVKSGAVIGSQAGILPGKIVREGVWWGTPVQPLDEIKRQHAHVGSLPRLKNRIKQLERIVKDLENR
ncbi:MAG: UDP-3-O-(3-hydroxymyristoyl)glucosamine N-acyltransferase [Acidobacteria bacterium]|nr:UDP-3-O-(3-hydroxymyristoyl)glucosamine N-acyltransferase [Acidobacteriota bacterium]